MYLTLTPRRDYPEIQLSSSRFCVKIATETRPTLQLKWVSAVRTIVCADESSARRCRSSFTTHPSTVSRAPPSSLPPTGVLAKKLLATLVASRCLGCRHTPAPPHFPAVSRRRKCFTYGRLRLLDTQSPILLFGVNP